MLAICFVFCFTQQTAYEMRIGVLSSDVCSSDLPRALRHADLVRLPARRPHRRALRAKHRALHPYNGLQLFLYPAPTTALEPHAPAFGRGRVTTCCAPCISAISSSSTRRRSSSNRVSPYFREKPAQGHPYLSTPFSWLWARE